MHTIYRCAVHTSKRYRYNLNEYNLVRENDTTSARQHGITIFYEIKASFIPIYTKLNIFNIVLLCQYCIIIIVRICLCCIMFGMYKCVSVYVTSCISGPKSQFAFIHKTFLSPQNEYIREYTLYDACVQTSMRSSLYGCRRFYD